MSGPIVRSGASPEFSKNWDSVFGKSSKASQPKGAAAKSAKAKSAVAEKAKSSKKKAAPKSGLQDDFRSLIGGPPRKADL